MHLCRNCTHYSCNHQGNQQTPGPFGEYGYFDGWTEECLTNQVEYFQTKSTTDCPIYKEVEGKCRQCENSALISILRNYKGFCSSECLNNYGLHIKSTQKNYEKYVKEIIRERHVSDRDDIDEYL